MNKHNTPFLGSIDLTNRCNLKCLHCFNRSNELKRDELTDKQFIDVIKQIAELKLYSFCFCGGETLLRYDVLLEGITILKKSGLKSINMVTNGMLLTDKRAKELKTAGISSIQVSLDGSCEKTHNKMRQNKDAFNGVLNAIEILEQNQIPFGVAFCPTKFNIHEFREVASMLNKYKYITDLRVQPLMVMGRANSEIEATEYQYRVLVETLKTLSTKREVHYTLEWGDPIDHLIRFGNVLKGETQLIINSNGDISVSPYLPLIVGNVKKHKLIEYINAGLCNMWETEIVQNYAQQVRCMTDLGKEFNGVKTYYGESKRVDLIDNREVFNFA